MELPKCHNATTPIAQNVQNAQTVQLALWQCGILHFHCFINLLTFEPIRTK